MVDVVLPVLMQRQATAVLVSLQWRCHTFSSLRLGVPAWDRGCALTVVDVPVVRQRQVLTAFRVLLRVWVRSFLRDPSRCTHSDSGHYSYVLLVTGWHFALVFSHQSMMASGRISGTFYVVIAPEQSATSLVGWSLPRNAWLNSGYIFLYSLWCFLDVFPTFSSCCCTRILRSILALLSVMFSLSLSRYSARFEELTWTNSFCRMEFCAR